MKRHTIAAAAAGRMMMTGFKTKVASLDKMHLTNTIWSFERYSDGTAFATASNTDSGSVVGGGEGPTVVEAAKALYRDLAAKFDARGRALVAKNGDVLTKDGALHQLTGEIVDGF